MKLFRCNRRWKIEAVGALRWPEVFSIGLRLAVFPDDEFGIVAAQPVAEWARVTRPIVRKKDASTVSAPFLADNFPAFLLIYPT